jgi:hypothetical protein
VQCAEDSDCTGTPATPKCRGQVCTAK